MQQQANAIEQCQNQTDNETEYKQLNNIKRHTIRYNKTNHNH